MRANAEQERSDNGVHRRSQRTREWQCSDSRGAEVKRDSNEVGDRNHLIALI